ncbi:10842_t:CDS:1, partial [Gigaspora margarita]
ARYINYDTMQAYNQNFLEQLYTIPSYIYMPRPKGMTLKGHNVLRKYMSSEIYRQCIKCQHWYKGSVNTHLRHQQYCYPYFKRQAVLTIQRVFRSWYQNRIDLAKTIQHA